MSDLFDPVQEQKLTVSRSEDTQLGVAGSEYCSNRLDLELTESDKTKRAIISANEPSAMDHLSHPTNVQSADVVDLNNPLLALESGGLKTDPALETFQSKTQNAKLHPSKIMGTISGGLNSTVFLLTQKTSTTPGIIRHRRITIACLTLSFAVLGLGAVDLGILSERECVVNTKFEISSKPKQPNHLPENYVFEQIAQPQGDLRLITNFSNDMKGYADKQGNIVIPANYTAAEPFSDGLAAVSRKTDTTGDINTGDRFYVYIDQTGKVVLNKQFKSNEPFENGVAPVSTSSGRALIDKQGHTVAASQGDWQPRKIGELYSIRSGNARYGIIDKMGNWVLKPVYDNIEPINGKRYPDINIPGIKPNPNVRQAQYSKIWKEGRCGLIDRRGKIVIQPSYEDVCSFNQGIAAVKKDGKFGFVDSNGKIIVAPSYDFVTRYDDIIAVKAAGNWSLIDRFGSKIDTKLDGPIANESSDWLKEGLAPFVLDNKCGFIDRRGAVKIAPVYDIVLNFSQGYAAVHQNGAWFFIDSNGKVVSPLKFSSISSFANDTTTGTLIGPLYGFMTRDYLRYPNSTLTNIRNEFKNGYTGDF